MNNFADESPEPAARYEQEEMRSAVWNALERLAGNDREIIILKDIQGLSYKEIAEIINCPMGTVMSRLYNARIALKSHLRRYYDETK